MQNILRKAAVGVAAAAAVAAAVMRIAFTPRMQEAGGPLYLSYVVIAMMAAAFVAVFVLVFLGRGRAPQVQELNPVSCLPLAVSSLLAGGFLAGTSAYDGWRWLVEQRTPPPNDRVISSLDAGTLFMTLAFGFLGGIFLLWLGVGLARGPVRRTARMALAALAPVAWMWFRLVRYELSYASAVRVSQSFYDFVMLIFTLLFLFSFARYISGTGERKPPEKSGRMLLVYALCAAVMSLSGPVTAFAMAVSGQTAAFNACRMAGLTDFGMGILALSTALTLAFAHPVPAAEVPPEEAAAMNAPAQAVPTAEDILREMRGDPRD